MRSKIMNPLFPDLDLWKKEWKGMPELSFNDLEPLQSIIIHFRNQKSIDELAHFLNKKITPKTKYIYSPNEEIEGFYDKIYIGENKELSCPKYPIYIISKGRWESRLTSKSLEKMNVPYHIVVEPQEYDKYASVINPKKILTLPFSNLGQGSIPARNWVWEHSKSIGAKSHWILDDNIRDFFRCTNNLKKAVYSGVIFRAAEDFVDRYENIAMSGFQYQYFLPRKQKFPAFILNTRIYSCILLRNDLPYQWRGKYNEDTDLSLRILKDGWCTILFNTFLCGKITTLSMKGGNMEELYKDNGRLQMAQSLVDQHPDVTTIVEKWNRFQHKVDYRPFKKNKLKLKKGIKIDKEINNYGMVLIENKEEQIKKEGKPSLCNLKNKKLKKS